MALSFASNDVSCISHGKKRGLKEDTGKPKERLRLRAIPSFQGRYFSLYLLKPGISKLCHASFLNVGEQ